jgi:hypothetical protein
MPVTTDDRELSKVKELLAEAEKLNATLKTGRLTKRVHASRTRKIHKLLAQVNEIIDRLGVASDAVHAQLAQDREIIDRLMAYAAQKKALKSGLLN